MKNILLCMAGQEDDALFDPDARDASSEPFIYLREELKKHSYNLTTSTHISAAQSEWLWFWDVPFQETSLTKRLRDIVGRLHSKSKQISSSRNYLGEWIAAGRQANLLLFLGEPPVTTPANYNSKHHMLFPTIFTWRDDYLDVKRYHKFYLPLPSYFPQTSPLPFKDKKLLVNISANKFSRHPAELYTARRRTIQYFETHFPSEFDLFGVGWNQNAQRDIIYQSYKGTVRHKWDTYPRYRFGLCYENCQGIPGYVSEKIFDCMRAKCIPIYWGTSNIDEYVDRSAFIDRTQFASDAELSEYLLSIDEKKYQCYIEAGESFIQSEKFKRFLPSAFAENIINWLQLK